MDVVVDVLWSDDQILVVNKPPGLLTIPDGYDPSKPHAAGVLRTTFGPLWIVHRLDRDTSGILILARSAAAHKALNTEFQERTVHKTYHAIACGSPDWIEREVSLHLRVDGDRKHRTVVDDHKGRPATTVFKVLERYHRYSLIEAQPQTGYTHQIRVHLASVGASIVADPLYGDGKPLYLSSLKATHKAPASQESPILDRTALHASRISFRHPTQNTVIELEAPYPKDFADALKHMRNHR